MRPTLAVHRYDSPPRVGSIGAGTHVRASSFRRGGGRSLHSYCEQGLGRSDTSLFLFELVPDERDDQT